MPAQNSLSQRTSAPRCLIYCRISHDDAADELGVKRQERNCRALVDRIGGVVAGVYVDNDRSAAPGSKPRDDFERLIVDLKAGAGDLIVVQNQDRISRDNVEVELFMRLLRSLGHDHYWTASAGRQGIKTTNDRLGYRVKGLFDTAYSEYISEKQVEKQEERAHMGLPGTGGKRAFGWSCHTPRARLHECKLVGCQHDLGRSLIPSESDGLRHAAYLVLGGAQLQAACDWLTDHGISTVTGAAWVPTVLKAMLLAPRIVGLREHHGDIVGPAAWPAILDMETWEALKVELSERYRPHAQPRIHALSGEVDCGLCHQKLHAQMVTRRGRRWPRYWCRPGRRGACGKVSVTVGHRLEDLVVDTVGGWLADPGVAEHITALIRGDDADGIDELVATVAAEEAHLRRIAREREEIGMELAEYQAMRAPVKQRLDAARAQLASSRRNAAAAQPLGEVTVEELAAAWPRMTPDERRPIIRLLTGVLEVHPATKGVKGWDPRRVVITPAWA